MIRREFNRIVAGAVGALCSGLGISLGAPSKRVLAPGTYRFIKFFPSNGWIISIVQLEVPRALEDLNELGELDTDLLADGLLPEEFWPTPVRAIEPSGSHRALS